MVNVILGENYEKQFHSVFVKNELVLAEALIIQSLDCTAGLGMRRAGKRLH